MMLDHVHQPELATRLRRANDATFNVDTVRTGDLGGSASTAELTRALVRRVANGVRHRHRFDRQRLGVTVVGSSSQCPFRSAAT